MVVLGQNVDDVIVIFALRQLEDRVLLQPAEARIKKLRQQFSNVIVLDGTHDGIAIQLEKLAALGIEHPVIIEIISHGSLSGTEACSDVDRVAWTKIASFIRQLPAEKVVLVNAMSTCMSFALVDLLCNSVQAVFANNLAASAAAFSQSDILYSKGFKLMQHGLDVAHMLDQYTWCKGGQRENVIDWQKRYELLTDEHQDAAYWNEWDPVLRKAAGIEKSDAT
ncbi:MAG: hypothetical protein JSS75_01525 [Bacteroidetes bacterium]|nr:hypothetical protein [Bacteroidota bacterium]